MAETAHVSIVFCLNFIYESDSDRFAFETLAIWMHFADPIRKQCLLCYTCLHVNGAVLRFIMFNSTAKWLLSVRISRLQFSCTLSKLILCLKTFRLV